MRKVNRLILDEEDKKVITDFLELLCEVAEKTNKRSKNVLKYFQDNTKVKFNNLGKYTCILNIDEIDFDEIKDEW